MSWSHRTIPTAETVRQENLPLNFAFDRAMGAVRVSPKQGVIGPGVAADATNGWGRNMFHGGCVVNAMGNFSNFRFFNRSV